MSAPSYTTDLTTISTGDSGTFVESTATGWTLGATPASGDAENFIQGTASVTKAFNATGVGTIMFDSGAGQTIPTDGAFLAWFYWASPQTLDTETNGGIRLIIGSAQNAHYAWKLAGKDTYPYGGWINYAADPAQTADYTAGSPTATWRWFGVAVNNLNAITKGNPMAMDAIRYGRCEARMSGGDLANGYATFNGYAATNDSTTNRWGLIQELNGAYQIKGLVIFGYSAVVDFRDSNKSIFIQNTKKVSANFNAFEVRQSTSRVDLTSISFNALGTVSRGNWITTDDADINITGCTFTDMGTFGFKSNSTILTSTFRRCNLITQSSAVFTGCTFDSTNDSTKAILSNNPANISNCTFVSSGTKHAIEINTAGTYSFTGNTFTGYATSNGSTGNEVIYNNSGGAVTLNYSGGSGVISYRNGTGASTTVASSVNLTIDIVDSNGDTITADCEVTVVKVSDESVLFHEDGITDGTTTYSFSSGSGTASYINVHNVSGYQNKTVYLNLPSSNTTTTVQLDEDRFYSNP